MAQSVAGKRDIVLNLSLPNGGAQQLRIAEGGTGSVSMPKLGKFGFVPRFRDGSDSIVVVELFDLSSTPSRRIGRMELSVGGDSAQSATTPQLPFKSQRSSRVSSEPTIHLPPLKHLTHRTSKNSERIVPAKRS